MSADELISLLEPFAEDYPDISAGGDEFSFSSFEDMRLHRDKLGGLKWIRMGSANVDFENKIIRNYGSNDRTVESVQKQMYDLIQWSADSLMQT